MNPTKPSESRTAEYDWPDYTLFLYDNEQKFVLLEQAEAEIERAKQQAVVVRDFTDGQILDMFNEWERNLRCWYNSKECFEAGFKAALKMIKESR